MSKALADLNRKLARSFRRVKEDMQFMNSRIDEMAIRPQELTSLNEKVDRMEQVIRLQQETIERMKKELILV